MPSFDSIRDDIDDLLKARAYLSDDEVTLPDLVEAALPALCRRLCELGAQVGGALGDTSADVLVCQSNDVKAGILKVRVFESFPGYALDRTINRKNGWWTIHTRQVHYRKQKADPALNNDVIAKALLMGRSHFERVKEQPEVASERHVVAVQSLLPNGLIGTSDLSKVRRGQVVSLSVVFYDTTGHSQTDPLLLNERLGDLTRLLSEIHELALVQGHDEATQAKAWLATVASLSRAASEYTLKEAVKLYLRELVGG